MDKKGQIFLIAAVVIAGIILTLGAINISIKTSEEKSVVYDLSKEIRYESFQLIDSGIYKGNSPTEINAKVSELVKYYSSLNPDTNFTFVYGNTASATLAIYEPVSSGQTCIGRTTCNFHSIKDITTITSNEISNDIVTFRISDGESKQFYLNPGQNFYLVLEQKIGEETYVAQQ